MVHGRPVLVHSETEVIFAFATGTFYALRLGATRTEAIETGATQCKKVGLTTIDLSSISEDWFFGTWGGDKPDWWQNALNYAGGVIT